MTLLKPRSGGAFHFSRHVKTQAKPPNGSLKA